MDIADQVDEKLQREGALLRAQRCISQPPLKIQDAIGNTVAPRRFRIGMRNGAIAIAVELRFGLGNVDVVPRARLRMLLAIRVGPRRNIGSVSPCSNWAICALLSDVRYCSATSAVRRCPSRPHVQPGKAAKHISSALTAAARSARSRRPPPITPVPIIRYLPWLKWSM